MGFLKVLRIALGSPEDTLQIQIDSLNNQISDLQSKVKLNPKDLVYPPSRGNLSNQQINAYNNNNKFSNYLDVADTLYSVPSKDDVISFLLSTGITKEKFKDDLHDCDDYAREFWTLINNDTDTTVPYNYTLAYARSPNHAFNLLIDPDNQIWIVEPQNGNTFRLQDVKNNPSMGYNLLYWPITMCLFP